MGTVKKEDRTILQKQATKILRACLRDNEISYKQLSRRIHELGWVEPERSISNKINRGTFSFQFVFLAMLAIGKKEIALPLPALTPELRAELKRAGARQRRRSYPGKQFRRGKLAADKEPT